MKEGTYIASQGLHDELRTMSAIRFLVNKHGVTMPLVLSGPKSSGKNHAVEAFAKEYLKLTEGYERQLASVEDTRFDYSGMPLLLDGESTFAETRLLRAMRYAKGGVWYLDEVDQLPQEVQKNLAGLMDDERAINVMRIIDGKAKEVNERAANLKDFTILMSYNPPKDRRLTQMFHPAFMSRCIEKKFYEHTPELSLYLTTGIDTISDKLHTRGIVQGKNGPLFLEKKDGRWYQNNREFNPQGEVFEYQWFDRGNNSNSNVELDTCEFKTNLITNFIPNVLTLSEGKAHESGGEQNYNEFDLFRPDIRTTSAIMSMYDWNIESGNYSIKDAQKICVEQIIDNMLRGDLNEVPLDGQTAGQYIESLVDRFVYNAESNNTSL